MGQLLRAFGWRLPEFLLSFFFADKEDPLLWRVFIGIPSRLDSQDAVHAWAQQTFRSSQTHHRSMKHYQIKAEAGCETRSPPAAGQLPPCIKTAKTLHCNTDSFMTPHCCCMTNHYTPVYLALPDRGHQFHVYKSPGLLFSANNATPSYPNYYNVLISKRINRVCNTTSLGESLWMGF